MPHTDLEEIFARFSAQFPPEDEYQKDLTICLTTHDVVNIFCDFVPNATLPDMYKFMTSHGYQYRAIEQNDTIRLCWLIRRL
jgi:hypothetical protein